MNFFTELILFIIGVFVGAYASVVGGGALILVPFFTIINVPLVTAIATMRLGAAVQEGVSTLAFARKKAIDWRNSLWIGIWAMFGGFIGSRITFSLDERILSFVIGLVMLSLLYLIPKLKMVNTKVKKPPKYKNIISVFGGLTLGIYGGFYGAGFGIFVMLFFASILGSNLFSSAGNARLVGFLMSAAASFGFWKNNLIDWNLFWPMTLGLVIGSWVGVDWAEKFGTGWIKLLLQLVVFASAIKLIFFP